MKSFNQLAVITAVTAGGLVGASEAHANYNASNVLPSNCTVFDVGDSVVASSEQALNDAGYPGITADGKISNEYEQEHVYRAQLDLKVIGALGSSVKICGYAGGVTQAAAIKAPSIDALASIEDVDETKSKPVEVSQSIQNEKYTIEDCFRYNEWSEETIKAVQKKVGTYVDGNFGNDSCDKTIKYQLKNGIVTSKSPFLGYLGEQTLSLMGVSATPNITTESSSKNLLAGCKAKYDVDYVICAETGPGTETGYFYKRSSDGNQKLLKTFELTSSQIDSDGYYLKDDTLTRKGHHIVGYATRKTSKLGLKDFLQFNGEQGIHAYHNVGAQYDSHGCLRVTPQTAKELYETLAVNSRAAFTANVEVIIN